MRTRPALHAFGPGLALCVSLLCAFAGGARADRSDYENGYVQVELVPGVTVAEVNGIYGTTTVDSLPPLYRLQIPNGDDEGTIIQQMLLDLQRIVAAEYAFNSDTPEGTRQMVVAAVGGTIQDYLDQDVARRLHLDSAHFYTTGQNVVVAILDSGVDFSHPALAGAIAAGGYDFVENDADPSDTANGIDDDGDGQTDEGAGHGTMVAGIVHLVAPGAQILPIRVLNDEGRGKTFAVARGIRYAMDHGANVINMSLGLYDRSDIMANEIDLAHDAGIAVVAAAGNDGSSVQVYPASDSHVFMVAALDSADVKAGFSNFGSKVEVSAPGLGIRAPYHDGQWAIGAGTSFAAPFVAGECALLREMEPGLNLDQLQNRVRASVVDISVLPLNQPYQGMLGTGRFDGYKMLITSYLVAGSVGSSGGSADAAVRVWPNPAPAGATIRVAWRGLPGAARSLGVFDALGRNVAMLATASPANGEIAWDGRDRNGHAVPAGAYFLRPAAGAAPGFGIGRVLIVP